MTCKFCSIAKHVKPEHIIFENKELMAFMSVEQLTKSHILVIPKAHVKDIYGLDEKLAGKLFALTTKLSKIVKKTIKPDGIDVYQCNGKYAGQEVFHFHLHIFPRFKGDGLFNIYDKKKPRIRHGKYLEEVAQKLRSTLKMK